MKKPVLIFLIFVVVFGLHSQEVALVISDQAQIYGLPQKTGVAVARLVFGQQITLDPDTSSPRSVNSGPWDWQRVQPNGDGWVSLEDVLILPIQYHNKSVNNGIQRTTYYSIERDPLSESLTRLKVTSWTSVNDTFQENSEKITIYKPDRRELQSNTYARLSSVKNLVFSRRFTSDIEQRGRSSQLDEKTTKFALNGVEITRTGWMRKEPETTDVLIDNSAMVLPYGLKIGMANSEIMEMFGMPEEQTRDSYTYLVHVSSNVDYRIKFAFSNYILRSIVFSLEI